MKDRRKEALRHALKMEEDGKSFYLKEVKKVQSKLAKEIFRSLIRAEEKHVRRIKELYESLEKTGEWPQVLLTRTEKETVGNIFATATATTKDKAKGISTDIDALKMAAKLEDEGMKYYQAKADETDDPFEKKFYRLLVHEEGEHFVSILDTIEYLQDPQGYFSQLERGTLSF
jgi:rubrerythrin